MVYIFIMPSVEGEDAGHDGGVAAPNVDPRGLRPDMI